MNWLKSLSQETPFYWDNPQVLPAEELIWQLKLGFADILDAQARLDRFKPLIRKLFPETEEADGWIESPLQRYDKKNLFLKMDSHLPISGSIKARGGIYEVLKHAETLALEAGILQEEDSYDKLADHKDFFGQYSIAVGSTGNLGLSIGIMGRALGFQVAVHMSQDARAWKKRRLRELGADVIEYSSDYSKAVEEGRKQAQHDPKVYFIDDENSKDLYLGYSVAALRVKAQLDRLELGISEEFPLHVYLPCGVGGGPGGIAFGLKLLYGESVKLYFAEPTAMPCMLLALASGKGSAISVQDIGLNKLTAADGLAVGRASSFVADQMKHLLQGCYTVSDQRMFELLQELYRDEGIRIEPSAAAALAGRDYVSSEGIHLAWLTGGSMVPDVEFQEYLEENHGF